MLKGGGGRKEHTKNPVKPWCLWDLEAEHDPAFCSVLPTTWATAAVAFFFPSPTKGERREVVEENTPLPTSQWLQALFFPPRAGNDPEENFCLENELRCCSSICKKDLQREQLAQSAGKGEVMATELFSSCHSREDGTFSSTILFMTSPSLN